ncbi:hypothetical protein SSYM_1343, partial [Serratia symbiotica str. Tucson]
LRHFRRQSR